MSSPELDDDAMDALIRTVRAPPPERAAPFPRRRLPPALTVMAPLLAALVLFAVLPRWTGEGGAVAEDAQAPATTVASSTGKADAAAATPAAGGEVGDRSADAASPALPRSDGRGHVGHAPSEAPPPPSPESPTGAGAGKVVATALPYGELAAPPLPVPASVEPGVRFRGAGSLDLRVTGAGLGARKFRVTAPVQGLVLGIEPGGWTSGPASAARPGELRGADGSPVSWTPPGPGTYALRMTLDGTERELSFVVE